MEGWLLLLLLTSGAMAKVLEVSELPANVLIRELEDIRNLIIALRQEIMHKTGSMEQDRMKIITIQQHVVQVQLEVALSPETLQNIRDTIANINFMMKRLLANVDRRLQAHDTVDKLLGMEEAIIVILLDIEDELDIPTQQAIKNQVDRLVSEGEKQRRKQLPVLVVNAIFSNDLQEAAKVFKQVDDRDIKSAITFIVKSVYGNNLINAQLLENFADHVNEVERKYETYQALYNEMLFNSHTNVDKFVKYANKLRAEVLDQSGTTREVEGGAKALIRKLEDATLTLTKTLLKEAIKRKAFWDNDVQGLHQMLQSQKGPSFAENVYAKVVEENFEDLPHGDLIYFSRSLPYIERQVLNFEVVYNRIKEKGHNDPGFISVGFILREIQEQPNYHILDDWYKYKMNTIKGELPNCLKNAAFADKICIKNMEYNEYLFSPDDDYHYDDDRRLVFTWIPGTKVEGAEWRFKTYGPQSEEFHLRNLARDEYLYGAGDHLQELRGKRPVFTWQRKEKDGGGQPVINGKWNIEVEGDDCYLQEIYHGNEYLYAGNDSFKWDNDRRRTFIHQGHRKIKGSKWRIEDCT